GHNWGKAGEDEAAQAQTDAAAEATGEDTLAETPVIEEEEDDNEMTLEEYEEMRADKRRGDAFADVELRRAEGPSEGTAYVKGKNDDMETFIKMGTTKKKSKPKRENKKVMVESNFTIRDSSEPPEAPRGGRGRGRGGRGRGRGGRGGARGGEDGAEGGFR
ncbi:Hypothetical Protein FCC1311_118362, partial [Hondaea fermentalgiana]